MRKLWTLLAVVLLAACGLARAAEQTHHIHGAAFGTPVEISIYGGSVARAGELGAQVLDEFARLHRKLHAWEPSALTALNDAIAKGEAYQADAELVYLLRTAADLAARSDNTFNPAIGRLIRLWGFHSSQPTPRSPPEAEIRHWLDANPRMSDLQFDGTRVSSRNRAVMIDLGGFAKGYALDRAAQILRAGGVKAALVDVGGNIMAIGRPGDRPWRVGIQDPRGDGMLASVPLHDNEAIGTSGDYQRFFMQNGKRRPHIIDPRTGQPFDKVASVTIITGGGSDAGTRSDGNSKPLFLSGPGRWQAMAERLGLTEAMLIDASRRVELTPALQARIRSR